MPAFFSFSASSFCFWSASLARLSFSRSITGLFGAAAGAPVALDAPAPTLSVRGFFATSLEPLGSSSAFLFASMVAMGRSVPFSELQALK